MSKSINIKTSIISKVHLIIFLSFISAFTVSNYLMSRDVSPLLSKLSDESMLKTSSKVLETIKQELNIAKTLAISLASIANSLPNDKKALHNLLPKVINAQGIIQTVVGGGIWPEPFKADPKLEKSSLFWGKNSQGKLIYFDDYNQASAPAYHNESWYTPVKNLKANQVHWSESYIDPYTQQHMITVSAPIFIDGDFYGVSTIDLNLDNIIQLITDSAEQLGGLGFLVDSTGLFISQPKTTLDQQQVDNTPLSLSILTKNNLNFVADRKTSPRHHQDAENIKFFDINAVNTEDNTRVLLLNMPETQWTLGFSTAKSAFRAPINNFLKKAATYQVITLFIFLAVIYFCIKKYISQPFMTLIMQLKNNDKLLKYPRMDDELGKLTKLFNQRHLELEKSRQQLRESSDNLQRALDSAHAGTVFFDAKSHTLEWDEKSSMIFGLPHDQLGDKYDALIQIVHPDDLEKITVHFKAAIDDPAVMNYEIEYRVILADQSMRWIQGSVRFTREADGTAISCSGLHFDLTERKASEASLIAQENAENSNRLKSEFLANMSHELRTPMHGILSFSEFGIKKSESAEREKLLQYFIYIKTSGQRLLALLNDLLDLSKVEAGKLVLNKQQADLNTIIDTCNREQQQHLADSGLSIQLDKRQARLDANFDEARITQVVCNLLSNAIKFSAKSTVINISSDRNDLDQLVFRIDNHGAPIPANELESIFDPFIQSSKPKSDITGTGLGLAISREFIEAHGGKIWAEANKEEGATFKFFIPGSAEATI
ncbi:hypothetical protein A9Q82_08735 [Cycloclasticus sp. 46_120_T64]|nr:hypothetical protein A9Q82_08735 [Cycloclasticus sp. 46_120_T64]